jgi:hypothetical protein
LACNRDNYQDLLLWFPTEQRVPAIESGIYDRVTRRPEARARVEVACGRGQPLAAAFKALAIPCTGTS